MARAKPTRTPLTPDERERFTLAVNSAFRKLKYLHARRVPVFEDFGFTRRPPAQSPATSPTKLSGCHLRTSLSGLMDLSVPVAQV
jgi:hypothetical protein